MSVQFSSVTSLCTRLYEHPLRCLVYIAYVVPRNVTTKETFNSSYYRVVPGHNESPCHHQHITFAAWRSRWSTRRLMIVIKPQSHSPGLQSQSESVRPGILSIHFHYYWVLIPIHSLAGLAPSRREKGRDTTLGAYRLSVRLSVRRRGRCVKKSPDNGPGGYIALHRQTTGPAIHCWTSHDADRKPWITH